MSLAIDVDTVTAVLLADGWHPVKDGSFVLDAYEFLWHRDEDEPLDTNHIAHGGGQSGVCAAGFAFKDANGCMIGGPLTAVLAVKYA